MVLIPAGEFWMGSPEGVGGSDEHLRHKVYLDAFYIDKYEVAAGMYRRVMQEQQLPVPGQPSWSTDDHPVVNVSWKDAAAYCKLLGKRLPTEAEWEKAARGGTDTEYHSGDSDSGLGEFAWYDGNSGNQAHPVGQKKPNQYGLYDTAGNVWEWVGDWYGAGYYERSPDRNPQGPSSGQNRVVRGGSWVDYASSSRAALRLRSGPDFSINWTGFRCARSGAK